MAIKRRDFLKGGAAGATATVLSGCAETAAAASKPHRWIDSEACIGCGQCVSLCPMGAISLEVKSRIDPDECAECGACWRSRACPEDAIKPGSLTWPRALREVFSNPLAEHEGTGVPGRGTEGIKTNDSIERFERGSMGVFIELGRPVLGARFHDVERVVKAFAARGYEVVAENPIAELVTDARTGALKPEVLEEKVISCVVEVVMAESAAGQLLEIVSGLSAEVESVFNVCVALRAREDGSSPARDLFGPGVFMLANGKVNIGLAEGIAK